MNYDRFEILTLQELQKLTVEVGINFTIGNENISDKQELILTLDEADPLELEHCFKAILRSRTKKS